MNNYDITIPILTHQDIPWSWPSTVCHYALRCPILNVPYREVGWEARIIVPIRFCIRTTIAIFSNLFNPIPSIYHLSMALFYKLKSLIASQDSFNRAYHSALAWEYLKTSVLDLCMPFRFLQKPHFLDWFLFPNSKSISFHLSASEVRIERHQSLFPHELAYTQNQARNALNIAKQNKSLGLHYYQFFIRQAYQFNELVDVNYTLSAVNQNQFLKMPLNESSVLQQIHVKAFKNEYKHINENSIEFPPTFQSREIKSYPSYPLPNLKRIITRIASLFFGCLSLIFFRSCYYILKNMKFYLLLYLDYENNLSRISLVGLNILYRSPLPVRFVSFIWCLILFFSAPLFLAGLAYSFNNQTRKLANQQKGKAELNLAQRLMFKGSNEEAVHWFGEAAKKEFPEAQRIYGLSRLISNQKHCQNLENIKEGLFWLAQAAKQGDLKALDELNDLMMMHLTNDKIIPTLMQSKNDPLKFILFNHNKKVTKVDAKKFFINLENVIRKHENPLTVTRLKQLQHVYHQEKVQIYNALMQTEFFIKEIALLITDYINATDNSAGLATPLLEKNKKIKTKKRNLSM